MKRSVVSLALTLSYVFVLFAGCGGEDDDRVSMPSSSRDDEGAYYQTVVDELTSVGPTEVLEDSITGWTTDDEEVESSEPIDVLTTDNCEDLVELLASTDYAVYSEFAETYKDKTIEFGGCITYLENHDGYDTRYDILLSGGDYVNEETANPGPTFKFEDVNTYALGIHDLSLPAFVAVGNNVHIIAEVVGFNADTGIFELKPVSISER